MTTVTTTAAQHRIAKQAAQAVLATTRPHVGTQGGAAALAPMRVGRVNRRRRVGRVTAVKPVALFGRLSNKAQNSSVQELVSALSALLTALGVNHTPKSILEFLKGGGGGGGGRGGFGGGGGGGGPGDYARRLVDLVLQPYKECVTCMEACRGRGAARISVDAARDAAIRVVRATDTMFRLFFKMSLVQYAHNKLVEYVDYKFRTKDHPALKYGLKYVGLKRLLWAGKLFLEDKTLDPYVPALPFGHVAGSQSALRAAQRTARVITLRWVFKEYVDYYLPGALHLKYDERLNRELFASGKYTKEIDDFLTGRDGDMSRVVGALVEHYAIMHNVVSGQGRPAGCMLCQNLPFVCGKRGGPSNVPNGVRRAALRGFARA